jgi:hypothetical protein
MNEKIIISSHYGGLGDNLAYSTLPEEFFKQKGIKISFSKFANFRNKEIYDLVWKKNPYVFFKVKKKNTINIVSTTRFLKKYNVIQNYEKIHGLDVRNKYPKIYYTPKKKKLGKTFLVDISSISLSYSKVEQDQIIQKIAQIKQKYKNYKFINVIFKKKLVTERELNFFYKIRFFLKNKKILFGSLKSDIRGTHSYLGMHFLYRQKLDDLIEIKSIFEYCDYIASCSGFISTHSGQSHLSSALKNQFNKKLKSFCLVQKKWYSFHKNKGLFIFDNINYVII